MHNPVTTSHNSNIEEEEKKVARKTCPFNVCLCYKREKPPPRHISQSRSSHGKFEWLSCELMHSSLLPRCQPPFIHKSTNADTQQPCMAMYITLRFDMILKSDLYGKHDIVCE